MISEWDDTKFQEAFTDMEDLARLLNSCHVAPDLSCLSCVNHIQILQELKDYKQGKKNSDIPEDKFLLAVNNHRTNITNGKFDKINFKLKKLEDFNGKEIFMKRKFRNTKDREETE